MKKYSTPATYKQNKQKSAELSCTGLSKTIPDQAYTIKELAERYEATGVLGKVLHRQGEYTGNMMHPLEGAIDQTDLQEKADLAADTIESAKNLKLQLDENEKREAKNDEPNDEKPTPEND